MNKVYKAMVFTAVMLGAMTSVYAARPPWAGPKEDREVNTKEEKAVAKESWKAEKSAARSSRQKVVSHVYLYDDVSLQEYDYEGSPWGRVLVHNKGNWAMVNAHNLSSGRYSLWYGGSQVGETTPANEYGDVHIKGALTMEESNSEDPSMEENENGSLWTLQAEDGTVVLTGTETRIMPIKDEEEMEY